MSIIAFVINMIIGSLAGVFGGMGMGGGTILIPLLTIVLGVEQKLAQAINLISFLFMAVFSLIVHFKHGLVKIKGLWFMIIVGIISSLLGAFVAGKINSNLIVILNHNDMSISDILRDKSGDDTTPFINPR